MQQRSDIQGLRAYAVVAVMLYHFGITGFSGGFIGVDVFFVISGFLMTSIIVRGLEKGKFSITDFYLARARRIIPALAVLCGILLALGAFWLGPSDYATLGKHATGAAAFFSNFTFMDEEGYFDAPSQSKWLLHTCSLSVEWQFYMLYPLLLAAIAHMVNPSRRALGNTIIVVGVLSLIASVFLTPRAASSAFYMLPTRAWELAAGGLVYLYAPTLRTQTARLCEWWGLALILVSAHFFHALMLWPGIAATVPVAGAALMMIAARQQSLLTNNAPAQALGRWSYSIYLWHWPIVVALGYFAIKTPLWIAVGLGASILLGAISYALVEQPARKFFTTRKATTIAAIGAVLLVCGVGTWIDKQHGIPSRVSPEIQAIDRESSNKLPPFDKPCGFNRKTLELTPCVLGDKNNIRWVVWGDSHAGSIVSAVQAATKSGVLYYTHACSTLFDTELKSKATNNHCTEFNHKVAEQIAALPRNVGVIIINRYSVNIKGPNEGVNKPWGFIYADGVPADPNTRYKERLADTVCSVADNRPVYIIAPIPEMGRDVPKTMLRAAMTGNTTPDVTLKTSDYRERNDIALAALSLASKRCGARILDPVPYLCDREFCHGARDGKPLYFDDDHLSESGNRRLLPMFSALKR